MNEYDDGHGKSQILELPSHRIMALGVNEYGCDTTMIMELAMSVIADTGMKMGPAPSHEDGCAH